MELFKIDLGRTKYGDAYSLQKKLVVSRSQDILPDCLVITEHEPVITMGMGTNEKNLLIGKEELEKQGIDIFEIERGGDITFHGPGQIVLYPIIDLRKRDRDAHRYLRDLENFVIIALKEIGLKASAKEGLTGIWVDDHKLGAIGVAISRWITFHGLALNVTTNLDYFKLINPCGITDYPVGSISEILGKEIKMDFMIKLLTDNFARFFNYKVRIIDDITQLPV